MPLKRFPRPVNWAYAAGELSLIVLGILIASAINRWDDNRRSRQDELAALREIHAGLASDVDDLRSARQSFESGDRSAEYLIAHIDRRRPYADSLPRHFGMVLLGDVFTPNSAAFESLKSRGLHTITNDSLRLRVTDHYEHTYGRIAAFSRMLVTQFELTIQPIYRSRFRTYSMERVEPNDYPALLDDTEFIGALHLIRFYRGFLLPQWTQAERDAQRLRELIAAEIERLQ